MVIAERRKSACDRVLFTLARTARDRAPHRREVSFVRASSPSLSYNYFDGRRHCEAPRRGVDREGSGIERPRETSSDRAIDARS